MEEFIPIDHKDSDPAYRDSVWQHIAAKLNTTLRPNNSAANLWGTWQGFFRNSPAVQLAYEIRPDGTLSQTFFTPQGPEKQEMHYAVRHGALEIDWDCYHCALSDQGEVILFNGDGSMVISLRRPTG